ncbi:hypothetical protein HFO82_21845 [Rhizobium leguminosarum]|uniref:hypothetical protein n=1 Tax=Rhizobium leguminosarum TaxID=384 RepID=UPI001C95A99B|nr:hypothetical protein [Rhizobium leguminosarum]MBY5501242.1 hypothetical protein [Rhizobium leguminosarum]
MLHSDQLAQTTALRCRVTNKSFRPINHIEAAQLHLALLSDALSLAQVSLATCFEGIYGVSTKRFTWAKVKLYYSTFYAIRARLMLAEISIFYVGRTPHALEARAGASIRKKSGNSHTVAFDEYERLFAGDVTLSQEIAQTPPLRWIEEQRNEASYRSAPFKDPDVPTEFTKPSSKIRAHLQAYLEDNTYIYTFDPEHALIAYPLTLLKKLNGEITQLGHPDKIPILKHYVDILAAENCFLPNFKTNFDIFDLDA